MTRERAVVVASALLLLSSLGIGLAATPIPTSGDIPLESDSGLVVTHTSDLPSVPFADSNTVELNSVRFNSSGTSSLTVDTFNSNGFTNISAVDASSNAIRINRSAAGNVTTLKDQITSARVTDPTPVASGDTDLIYSAAADSRVTVDTNGNGIVAVDLSSGTALDEATPDANGTATVTLPSGSNQAVGFEEGPSKMTLRNVSEPQSTISGGGDAEIRFYQRDDDTVFVRDGSGGTVSFAGLPKTSAFVVKTNISGYVDRRLLVDSIFQQQDVYLLPDNASNVTTVETRFSVSDKTGNFGSDAVIQLARPVNTSATASGEETYVNVAGGVLGDARELQTTLEQGVRYRITISEDGQTRQLGSVIAKSDRVYNLEITGISFGTDKNQSVGVIEAAANVSGSGASKTKELTLKYSDSEGETTAFSAVIHERNNYSNQLVTVSPSRTAFPLGTYRYTQTVSGDDANTTWVANVSYERLGTQQEALTAFGASQFSVGPTPLGQGWRSIFGVGLLVVMGGAFSIGNARIGALIIPGVGFVLLQIGWLAGTTTLVSVGLAFSVAVLYNLVRTSGGVP